MAQVFINDKRCKGCGLCIDVCSRGILAFDMSRLNEKGYHPIMVTDMEKCIACAMCARMCPDTVFEIEK